MIFIIILNATADEPATLATRRRFVSADEAQAYIARWDATWQAQATIVKCPVGLSPAV